MLGSNIFFYHVYNHVDEKHSTTRDVEIFLIMLFKLIIFHFNPMCL